MSLIRVSRWLLAKETLRRFSFTSFLSSRFFSVIAVSPMIAFIGVRMSCDIVERKSVFALFADSASFAPPASFLLKWSITARSKTNRIKARGHETDQKPVFGIHIADPLIGMKLKSVQPSVAESGI